MKKCPVCNKEYPDKMNFCPKCKVELVQLEKRCPHCNEIIEDDWDMCGYCGENLTKNETSNITSNPSIPSFNQNNNILDDIICDDKEYAIFEYTKNSNGKYIIHSLKDEDVLDIVIPKDVEKIGDNAFEDTEILSITFNEGLKVIGDSAFNGCNNLIKVVLPKSLQKLGDEAFANCERLEEINITDSIKIIGEDVISNTKKEELEIEEKEKAERIKPYQENGIIYINYGKFPQTHVSDEELIENILKYASISSEGYYEYEGNEYIKINAIKEEDTDCPYSDGCELEDGQEEWFKVEPIKWRVLSNKNHKLTIVSEYLLQAMAFDDKEDYSNDYENSSIREWLNNDFYNIAFTEEEKEKIIENDDVDDDSVWLLSLEDLTNTKYGFSSDKDEEDETRKAKPTDYALATGAYFSSGSLACNWWLRTPDPGYSGLEYYVCTYGSIYDYYVNSRYLCARPSLIIEIE